MNEQTRREFVRIAGSSLAGLGVLGSLGIREGLCGSKRTKVVVPSYLKGYEELYAKNPRAAALQWFKDAKFGMMIHYCLVSVFPGGRNDEYYIMSKKGKTQSERDALANETLAKFTAEKFDADSICDLALSAEMKYVNFTTRHIGDLYMFKTNVSKFNSLNSPAKRDFVAEMARACAKRGMGLFLYVPPNTARTTELDMTQNQTVLRELLTQYGPIAGIWFDGIAKCYREPEKYSRLGETYAMIRKLQGQCLISFKQGFVGTEDFIAPEHEVRHLAGDMCTALCQEKWEKIFQYKPAEICTTMQEGVRRDGVGVVGGWINDVNARHLSADEVMKMLTKAFSQNANLNLNTGPLGDGSIHPEDVKCLREIGKRIRKSG